MIVRPLLVVLMLAAQSPGPATIPPQPRHEQPEPACPPAAATAPLVQQTRSLRIVSAGPENVGVVASGVLVLRTVEFENTMAHPVRLSIESRSCGCLSATLTRATLEPGARSTFTMSTSASPATGAQLQVVGIQSAWDEHGQEESETINVGLTYETKVSFTLFPTSVFLIAIEGERAHADVFISNLDPDLPAPEIGAPSIDLPGWTVSRVRDPDVPERILWFRAEGPSGPVGQQDGAITWLPAGVDNPEVGTAARAPIRIITLYPYRAQPGGLVLTRRPGSGSQRATLRVSARLIPRGLGAARPASVTLDDAPAGLTVVLRENDTLEATLTPDANTGPIGSARARVVDASGRVLLDLPVVWHTAAPAPAPPHRR
ncbi:MAG: DUF1573 domain-containing protein [Phycisphaerae bacterium]|nr:DUF1573 domain-containing protein [Phycisphaerae bacterium]